MKLLVLSDLHGKTKTFSKISRELAQADWLLLCGDITHFGDKKEVAETLKTLAAYQPKIAAILGNCDPQGCETALGAYSAEGKVLDLSEAFLIGCGASTACPVPTPNELSENTITAILEKTKQSLSANNKPLLVLTHQAAYGTCADQLANGMHVGSKLLMEFYQKHQPLFAFSGHIHEGRGIEVMHFAQGVTTIINPGPWQKGYYAVVCFGKDPYEVKLCSI